MERTSHLIEIMLDIGKYLVFIAIIVSISFAFVVNNSAIGSIGVTSSVGHSMLAALSF